jgi:thioesterase domain-containing protein
MTICSREEAISVAARLERKAKHVRRIGFVDWIADAFEHEAARLREKARAMAPAPEQHSLFGEGNKP